MLDISDKKITIIGSKRTGLALARLVLKLGGIPKISDLTAEDQCTKEFREFVCEHQIEVEYSGHTELFIQESDILVISPGVRLDSDPVQWAKDKNIAVLGEIEFASQFCDKPIIAVTGSNGKTTVSTLINEVLNATYHKSKLCGNVGYPFSDYVLDLDEYDFIVLELSSFQLESMLALDHPLRKNGVIKGFKPHVAVFLNFSQNHLDRHKDLSEYFQAKKRLFLNQDENDHAVLNALQDDICTIADDIKSQVHYFNNLEDQELSNPNYDVVRVVAAIFDIGTEQCNQVFENFQGVEHRLEWVRKIEGIDFINDSKATTAEASRWALKSIEQPIVMICGGRDKNIDFSVLNEIVALKVKKIFAFGEAKEKIKNTFESVVGVEMCEELENAVRQAKECASEGDCVVLTPMCASFDMFCDYEERGKVYKQIVKQLI